MREAIIRAIVAAIGLIGTAAVVIDWNTLRWHATEQWTNDAQLRGDPTRMEARVTGYVTRVAVEDDQPVKAGQVLYEIEPNDYQAQVDQANANLEAASARVAEAEAEVALQQARVASAAAAAAATEAGLVRASQEKSRQDALLNTAGGLRRDWETATADQARLRATLAGDRAQTEAARAQVEALQAQVAQARAQVRAQQAGRDVASINLGYTQVKAPADGVVGARTARLGQYVTPGALLITFIPARDVWIVANYREQQMDRIRVGQPVGIEVDAYPDLHLRGRVESIGPVSQSRDSLLPPQRATGNFVKIVQRIPVRITLDPGTPGLLPGLSVETRIDTSASGG
jgi:membrane fusion protein (multidrug efflux system)